MNAPKIFKRLAELLDVSVVRAAAHWIRINADGSISFRTAAETLADLGGGGGGGGSLNWGKLLTVTIANTATVDITGLTGHRKYLLEFEDVTCSAQGYELRGRTSVDNGATFDAVASTYSNALSFVGSYRDQNSLDDHLKLSFATRNREGDGLTGELILHSPNNALLKTVINGFLQEPGWSSESVTGIQLTCRKNEKQAVNALRLYFNTGNVYTGKLHIFGWNE